MADLDKLVADLFAAIKADDEDAQAAAGIALAVGVLTDLRRIADAVEAIKTHLETKPL